MTEPKGVPEGSAVAACCPNRPIQQPSAAAMATNGTAAARGGVCMITGHTA